MISNCPRTICQRLFLYLLNYLGALVRNYVAVHVWFTDMCGFQVALGKEAACSAGDTGSFPGVGRKRNTLQNSCLENPMDREAWRAAVHGSQRVRHNWSDLAQAHTSQFYSTDLYVCLYARTMLPWLLHFCSMF